MKIRYLCSVMLCISSLMQAGEKESTERKTTPLKSLASPSRRNSTIELFDVPLNTLPPHETTEIQSERVTISPFMSFLLRFFDFLGCGGNRGKQPYSPLHNHNKSLQPEEDYKDQDGDDIR